MSLTRICRHCKGGQRSRTFQDVLCRSFSSILISVEGNVGAGKSSLIEVLKSRHKDWNFIAEPVDVWSSIKSDNGESLLEVYYKDRKRWSYSFQSYALLSRFQNTQNAMALATQSGQGAAKSLEKGGDDIKTIFVTERCIETDYHVFVKMLRDQGAMDRLELELYDRLYRHLQNSLTAPLSAIIHVDTSPVECLQRIKSRNRVGESVLTLEYLASVEKYQRSWMDSLTDMPVMATAGTASGSAISEIESFVNRQLVSARDRRSYNVCL